jgi:hypothetical protein
MCIMTSSAVPIIDAINEDSVQRSEVSRCHGLLNTRNQWSVTGAERFVAAANPSHLIWQADFAQEKAGARKSLDRSQHRCEHLTCEIAFLFEKD